MRVRVVRSGLVVVESCRCGGGMARSSPGFRYSAFSVLMRRRHVRWQPRCGWQQEATILRCHIVMVVVLVNSPSKTQLKSVCEMEFVLLKV